ncbi:MULTISPECIES: hypothetical protein [Paraburkholderia]|uniref:Uncharacterized protein n=1 Tax=Paraburkholderia madseniana TaxID=2599607 RepID=A0AAP5BL19_9BURK|nr:MULTISPECIES: hypothetical protein [Paraburkholderia]MCX4150127.1 hypothetical protein [Paraburkholderia madseniana]MDN7153062.1 hypothetical protein [Paraburkholderia sp. WS6]MDQ6411944.1 hypothetical protein [Paraburkholderia madseniana]
MQGSLVTPALVPLDTLREQIAQAVAAAKAYDVPGRVCQLGIQQAVEEGDAEDEIWKESPLRQHNGLGYWAAVNLGPVLNACQPVCGSFR